MSFIFRQRSGAFDISMFEIGEDILTSAEKKRIGKRSHGRAHFKTENGHLVGPDEIRKVGVEEPSRKFVGAVRRLAAALGDGRQVPPHRAHEPLAAG